MTKALDERLLQKTYELKKKFDSTLDLKSFEQKLNDYEAKRKDVMNTTNTGWGLEAYRNDLYVDELYSQIASDKQTLISKLPWSHGDWLMTWDVEVTIKWETGNFQLATEPTGSWQVFGDSLVANTEMATWRVTIPIKWLTQQIFISRDLVTKSTDERLLETIRERIISSARRTIDYILINGDSTTTSQNINAAWGSPSSTNAYYGYSSSIRKEGIDNGVVGSGTYSRTNTLLPMLNLIDRYASVSEDLLWVMPYTMWNKTKMLSEYSTIDVIWQMAGNVNANLKQVEGIEAYVTENFPNLTDTNGKTNVTSSNNTKGSLAIFYKPAVQYGFGQAMYLGNPFETFAGFFWDAGIYFGSTVTNEEAGLDKSTALGANITI